VMGGGRQEGFLATTMWLQDGLCARVSLMWEKVDGYVRGGWGGGWGLRAGENSQVHAGMLGTLDRHIPPPTPVPRKHKMYKNGQQRQQGQQGQLRESGRQG
jgi:hypothetical protein